MTTIYQIIVITSLTFVAIMVALFVFASSIYKGAIKIAIGEEQEALKNRREYLKERRKEIVEELEKAGGDEFAHKLRESVRDFDAKTKQINQSILKSRDRIKRLSLKSMVVVPGLFLVLSITGAGIAAVLSGGWQVSVWSASVVALIIGIVLIYRNLNAIEKFSSVIDVSVLMEQALDAHAGKTSPKVFLDFYDEDITNEGMLGVGRGEIVEIEHDVSLIQGTIGIKTRVWFTATEELEFIDEGTIEDIEEDYGDMTKPKRVIKQYGDVNPKEFKVGIIKVKAPEKPGNYSMSSFLQCDGFTEGEYFFKIVVK